MRKKKLKRIGVFLDTLDDICEFTISEGIKDGARGNNVKLLFFESSYHLPYLGVETHYRQVEQLIINSDLDGLIIASGFMLEHFTTDEFREYVEGFKKFPIVSISHILEGIPSLLSDNKTGMTQLVNHLLDSHNCETLAFIAGPKTHLESNQRLGLFKSILRNRNIDSATILHASKLTPIESFNTIKEFHQKVSFLPDAIICCDDYTAIGVIEYLSSEGFSIPDDIIITGFDDISFGEESSIQLTTVKQPFYKIGYEAFNIILNHITGAQVESIIEVDTTLLIRKSCGCLESDNPSSNKLTESVNNNSTIFDSFITILTSIDFIDREVVKILSNIVRKLSKFSEINCYTTFNKQITRLLSKMRLETRHLHSCRLSVNNILNNNPELSRDITELCHGLLAALDENLITKLTDENRDRALYDWKYNVGNQLLLSSNNMESLIKNIYKSLPHLSIKTLFIYLYKSNKYTTPEWSELLVAYENGTDTRDNYPSLDRTNSIIKRNTNISDTDLIYVILSFNNEDLGYMLVDYNSEVFNAGYGVFRVNIGTAIRNALIMQQLNNSFNEKTDFFVNISHELKTPLTLTINAFEKYIKSNSMSPELELLRFNLFKMKNDVNNLLDIERIEKNTFKIDKSGIISFSELLKTKIAQFKETASLHKIKIRYNIDDNIITNIDSFSMERVLNNLLENAIKYNKKNGSIDISLTKTSEYISLTISDSGIGIDKNDLPFIFDPYFQVSQSNKLSQGFGMGLSIVKNIIEEAEGSITIDSASNKGTEIKILLPSITGDSTDLSTSSKLTDVNLPKINLENIFDNNDRISILAVDDNPQILYFLRELLQDEYNIYCAGNGYEALETLRDMPKPSLIITDIMMNRMDGYKFISNLKRFSQYSDIPVIIVTAKGTDNERLKGLSEGSVDYIVKPFLYDELVLKIKNLIQTSKNQQQKFIGDFRKSLDITISELNKQSSSSKYFQKIKDITRQFRLSTRESEIIVHLVNNLRHKEIAERTNLSVQTIRNISHIIYQKCHISNKSELIELLNTN